MLIGCLTHGLPELFEQLLLFTVQFYRCFYHDAAYQIANRPTPHRLDTFAAHAEKLVRLGAGRNLQIQAATETGDFKFTAQRRGDDINRHLAIQVGIVALEYWVGLDMDLHEQIARWRARLARFGQPAVVSCINDRARAGSSAG